MMFSIFLKRFLLHAIWASTLFVLLILSLELFIPGSVTPFIDPMPFIILSLVLLSADAMLRGIETSVWNRIIAGALLCIVAILIISFDVQTLGRGDWFAIVLMIVMMIGLVWMMTALKQGKGSR